MVMTMEIIDFIKRLKGANGDEVLSLVEGLQSGKISFCHCTANRDNENPFCWLEYRHPELCWIENKPDRKEDCDYWEEA